jgi:hypothetical protein
MRELRRYGDFPSESHRRASEDGLRAQDLDGHLTVFYPIVGEVNLAHPAKSKGADNQISVRESGAGLQGVGVSFHAASIGVRGAAVKGGILRVRLKTVAWSTAIHLSEMMTMNPNTILGFWPDVDIQIIEDYQEPETNAHARVSEPQYIIRLHMDIAVVQSDTVKTARKALKKDPGATLQELYDALVGEEYDKQDRKGPLLLRTLWGVQKKVGPKP